MSKRTKREAPPPRFREPPARPSEPVTGECRATLRMPRVAADMFADVDEATGLAWALVSVLEPSVESGLNAPYVKGALEVAYCALERVERLQKDIERLSNDEEAHMHERIRAGSAL